jgi:hypothetical protein
VCKNIRSSGKGIHNSQIHSFCSFLYAGVVL